jgi:gas vesicle protein
MNKDKAIGLGIGILIGAVAGAAVALLFAPQSGRETRKMIKDKTMAFVDTVKETAAGVIDVVKDGASDMNRKGHAVVNSLKN